MKLNENALKVKNNVINNFKNIINEGETTISKEDSVFSKNFNISSPWKKDPINNKNIANYIIENPNNSTDGLFDINNDGTNDGNITYIRDKNNNVIGASIFSLDGEKKADIDLEFDEDMISKIAIDNDFDNIEDYTHYLEYETSKLNNGDTHLSYERIEKKNKNTTTITERKYSNTWFFDSNAKRTETTSTYNTNGEITKKEKSKYDSKGNERYNETERYENNEVTDRERTEYDTNGNIKYSRVEEYENGVLIEGEETFYNKDEDFIYSINTNGNNGKVDFTEQGGIGDCWLLASVNALNNVDPEIMKDMISYTDDGAIIDFAFESYEITNEELQKEKAKRQYSTGDDDMIRIEIAMEKYLNDFVDGKLNIPKEDYILNPEKAFWEHGNEESNEILIDGGFAAQGLYLMTGKEVDIIKNTDSDLQKNMIIKGLGPQINNKEIAATCGFKKDKEVTDINGNTIELKDNHAYTIKSMNSKTTVIINPHDSSTNIEISTNKFLKNYRDITTCDINGEPHALKKATNFAEDVANEIDNFVFEVVNGTEEFFVDAWDSFTELFD